MPNRSFTADDLLQILFVSGLFVLAVVEGIRKQKWSTFLWTLMMGLMWMDCTAVVWPRIGGSPTDKILADPALLERFYVHQCFQFVLACFFTALPWLAAWFCGKRGYIEYLAAKRFLADSQNRPSTSPLDPLA